MTDMTWVMYRNFCKDHREKTEVPDPLVEEDLISYKSNNIRKLAKLITQYRDNNNNNSNNNNNDDNNNNNNNNNNDLLTDPPGGWLFRVPIFRKARPSFFFLCNTLKKEGRAFRNIGKYILILCNQPC